MANVSSSNGLEKCPKLRFPGFDEPYKQCHIGDIYEERSQRGASGMELLSVTMNDGVMPRSEIEGKDNSSEDKSNYKIVRKGDMVYNSMRMWQGANGISPCDGIVSPAYTVLMPKQEISNGYFAALFKSTNLINEFRKNSQGMTSDTWNLKYPQIKTIKVLIPSVSEQEKVSELFSVLDARIAAQAQLVEVLKKYKRGLLREVFNKSRLTSEYKYNYWKEVKLGEICTYRRGSFPQPYGLPEWYDEDHGMPFIQVADVNDNMTINLDTNRHISDTAKNRSVFIPEGTLIVTLQGTIGRVAITTYDAYIDRTLLVIQNISDCVLKEFLMYAIYMKFDVEKQTADGSIIKTITKETLTNFSIYLPPMHEQQRIVNLLRSFDRRLENSVVVLAELQEFRSALLQQLFI